jgi:hypothetical protein
MSKRFGQLCGFCFSIARKREIQVFGEQTGR